MTEEEFKNQYSFDPKNDVISSGLINNLFKAYDRISDSCVVLKIANNSQSHSLIQLQRELSAYKHIKEHPNIVHYLGHDKYVSSNNETLFLVLQYYPKGDLAEVNKLESLSLEDKESIGRGLIAGLMYLSKCGIVHNDLKPSNVLLTINNHRDYVPKIGDFGSCLINKRGGNTADKGIKSLSLYYTSPEKLINGDIGEKSDVWSLGVVLYELFYGNNPFKPYKQFEDFNSQEREVLSLVRGCQNISYSNNHIQKWNYIIKSCLVFNPQDRADIEQIFSIINKEDIYEETLIVENDVEDESDNNEPKLFRYIGILIIVVISLIVYNYWFIQKANKNKPDHEESISVIDESNNQSLDTVSTNTGRIVPNYRYSQETIDELLEKYIVDVNSQQSEGKGRMKEQLFGLLSDSTNENTQYVYKGLAYSSFNGMVNAIINRGQQVNRFQVYRSDSGLITLIEFD